ncbi:MAG: hypothetical protein GQ578_00245 [Desulfuromonadaceae bacterium]|nr:hypothetical protein [Desulfuromonadaceae bacterium]
MKSRKNFLSLNKETEPAGSAVALKAIILIAIFATGIFCTLGSGSRPQSKSKSYIQAKRAAQNRVVVMILACDDSQLQTEIDELNKKIRQHNDKIDRIYETAYERAQQRGIKGYAFTGTQSERRAIRDARENIELLKAERNEYRNEVEIRAKAGCFTAETKILTEKGHLRIADIKAGDRVLTVDPEGNPAANNVVKTFTFTNNHYYFINEKIKVTAQHRFYTGEGWTKTQDLKIGDKVQLSSGAFEEIISKERFPADLTVYNLHIADNHNFFVSADGKNGYLVHNCGNGGGK